MAYITMYDSVTASLIPADAAAIAAYVNGKYANYPGLRASHPHADILGIAVSADHDADCLDVERWDATPDQAPGWVIRQHARGIARPCLYASVSALPGILGLLASAGIARASVRIWSAHYKKGEHICGPASCAELGTSADGTQWTDTASGLNLDQSLLLDDFFTGQASPGVACLTMAQTEAIVNQLPVLKQGMSDAQLPHQYVRRLQLILSGVYRTYTGAIDGIYGAGTASAAKAVQKQYGLVQDGICGPATWGKVITG